MLQREHILGLSRTLATEAVEVPEWGGQVHVRELTAGERDRFEVQVSDSKRANFRARLAVFAVCDDKGARLFQESDIPELAQLPSAGLVRVCEVALRINKFSDGQIKELEKNSEDPPAGGPS